MDLQALVHHVWGVVTTYLAHNTFLSGGAILGVGGVLIAKAKSLPSAIYNWFMWLFFYTIIIEEGDPLYKLFLNDYVVPLIKKRNAKSFRVSCPSFGEYAVLKIQSDRDAHFFGGLYKFFPYWITLSDPKQGANTGGSGGGELGYAISKGMRPATCKVSFFSFRRVVPIAFITEVVDKEKKTKVVTQKIEVYTASDGDWFFRYVPARAIRSLEYSFDSEAIVEDCKTFFKSEEWYRQRSIPHRRGLLLSGPPGNGKTNMIVSLASECQKPIYFLQITKNTSVEKLSKLMRDIEDKCLLVIEDIDAIFTQRDSVGHEISFSSFINLLDGVMAASGVYLIMTSNHPERLDAALVRPGRIDKHIKIPNACPEQAGRYFKKFYMDATEEQVESFKTLIPEGLYSMAQIQGHFLLHRDDIEGAATTALVVEEHIEEAPKDKSKSKKKNDDDEEDDDEDDELKDREFLRWVFTPLEQIPAGKRQALERWLKGNGKNFA